jgi:hypothetical protein
MGKHTCYLLSNAKSKPKYNITLMAKVRLDLAKVRLVRASIGGRGRGKSIESQTGFSDIF